MPVLFHWLWTPSMYTCSQKIHARIILLTSSTQYVYVFTKDAAYASFILQTFIAKYVYLFTRDARKYYFTGFQQSVYVRVHKRCSQRKFYITDAHRLTRDARVYKRCMQVLFYWLPTTSMFQVEYYRLSSPSMYTCSQEMHASIILATVNAQYV